MSKAAGPQITSASDKAINLLRAHPVAAKALPDPSVEWAPDDVPVVVSSMLRKFRQSDVVEVVDRHCSPGNTAGANVYRTPRAIHEWVEANVDEPETFPCGHPGFRNVEGGGYTCRRDFCDEEFSREIAEEVFGG